MRGGAWLLGGTLGTLVALVFAGCGGFEACADLGEEVLLTAQVTDNGERARVEIELRRVDHGADSIPVKLCEGSGLHIDEVATVEVKRPSGAIVHEAELPAAGEGPLMRRLALTSPDGTSEFVAAIDAPGFAITAPVTDAEVSRAAGLAISWTPGRGEDATISIKIADEIDGDACLGEPLELEEPDDGEFTVGMAQVETAPKIKPTEICDAFVTLSRTHDAPLKRSSGDAELHPDSRVQATTSRTVTFVSVP